METMTTEQIRVYLDAAITKARADLADAEQRGAARDAWMCVGAVDAFQSVRATLFGEPLPHPDGRPTTRLVNTDDEMPAGIPII